MKSKIIRTSTVSMSLNLLLKGQLKFLSTWFNVVAVSSPGNDLDIVFNREKVKVIPVKMERSISIFKDFKSLINLYKVFKKEKPLIVHSITPKAGLLSMTAAYLARVPIRMHTFTGLIFPSKVGFLQKLLILMDRLLCRFATNIYPEGNGVKLDLQRYNITSKPLIVLGNGNVNGVNLEYFNKNSFTPNVCSNIRQQYGISDDDFVFCFVGRIVKDKGIIELVNAFESIGMKNAKLILVGDFELHLDPLPTHIMERINNNLNIITTGFQVDVRPFYAISHVFVFPSFREGFPNVVLQAGAMELPCIVTDISGSNEIIQQSINGLIVDVGEVSQLTSAMVELMENRTLFEHLKINSRNLIAEKYSEGYVWDCLKQEYDSLILKYKNEKFL